MFPDEILESLNPKRSQGAGLWIEIGNGMTEPDAWCEVITSSGEVIEIDRFKLIDHSEMQKEELFENARKESE